MSESAETLCDLKITPEDIDADYADENQLLEEYTYMMQSAEEDLGAEDVIDEMGVDRQNYYQCRTERNRFLQWVQEDKLPRSVRAILALHEMGIFPAREDAYFKKPQDRLVHGEVLPFDQTNANLLPINVLGSIAFWRGNIHTAADKESPRNTSKIAAFGGVHTDTVLRDLIAELTGKNPRRGPYNYIYADASHSRLLAVLGSPMEHKNQSEVALPRLVELALGTLASEETTAQEKRIAKNIVRDFVLSFFYLDKHFYRKGRGFAGYLPSSIRASVTESRINGFRDAVEEARFETRIAVTRTSTPYKNRSYRDTTLHQACVRFLDIDKFDIEIFKAEFRLRVQRMIERLQEERVTALLSAE